MVSDVRQKIGMRLEALLDALALEVRSNADLQDRLAKGRTDYRTATELKAEARSHVVRAFPGCRITFTKQYVCIYVPDGYPHPQISIGRPIPVNVIEWFSPLGLSNKPF